MTKNDMRLTYAQLRDNLSSKDREGFDKDIRTRLFQTEAYRKCGLLFVYLSFRSEVDTREIITKAISDQKKVFLPRIIDKDMEFYEIHDLKGLQLSKYGIEEPQEEESKRFTGESQEDGITGSQNRKPEDGRYHYLMLLPGLAFDAYGNRIGYGAGYYDKYLASHDRVLFYKLGLAYDLQVADHINADIYDVKTDCVLTPTRLLYSDKK